MTLVELVKPFQILRRRGPDVPVLGLVTDSRQVKPGFVFAAESGTRTNGLLYLKAALLAGAAAVIVEDDRDVPEGVPCVVVPNVRRILGALASRFYGDPSTKLHIAGITGTNGKTSTTYLAEAVLRAAGYSVGVIGTVNYRYAGRVIAAENTTPGPIQLQQLLADMVAKGVTHVLMEVSSHALDQYRVDGTQFACAVFTNLTRDHLDYHQTLAAYARAKRRLFQELLVHSQAPQPTAIVNADDPVHTEMVKDLSCRIWRFSLAAKSEAEIRIRHRHVDLAGSQIELYALGRVVSLHSPLAGAHNIQNIMQAVGIGLSFGLDLDTVISGLADCAVIPGRLERVADAAGRHVFVDYSHTPDALEQVAGTLHGLKGHNRLIIVVGCGGDRDRGKRPLMGEVAGRLGDVVIVTSDNPRTEDPEAILAEIEPGVQAAGKRRAENLDPGKLVSGCYAVVESRREAIALAVRIASPGDAVLIAGKGHEDYQIIGTVKHHFDDREEAAAALARHMPGGRDA